MKSTIKRIVVTSVIAAASVAAVAAAGALLQPSWTVSAKRMSDATPEQVWAWYTDTESVPKWDPLVKGVAIDGSFETGTSGTIICASGWSIPWVLASVVRLQHYTQVLELPFAKLEATHVLTVIGSKTRIEHDLTISGPLAWLYSLLLRGGFVDGIQQAIERLARDAVHGLPN